MVDITIDPKVLLFLSTIGTGAVVAISIFLFLHYWPKIEAFITYLNNLFADISKSGKSGVIRRSLQSELNTAITAIDNEVSGIFEKGVKVEWLSSEEEHINANRRGVFIRVKESEDVDKLFLKSMKHILDNALLVKTREYIHGHVFEGIKLVLSEKMISHAGLKSAMVKFRDETYNPALAKNKSLAQATNHLEFLEYRGLFTRVFLRECIGIDRRVGAGHEGSKPRWDVSRFLEYTNKLFNSLDRDGVRADFEYSSSTINVAFAVLADEYTWASGGLEFYKKRTRLSIQRGASTIYIVALGTRNVKLANGLAASLQADGILNDKSVSYYNLAFGQSSNVSAVCIRCDIKPQAKSLVQALANNNVDSKIILNDSTLHDVIRSIVQDQEVEIIKSAWIKEYHAQVLVHSKNPRKNAVQICIGKGATTAKEISKLVGDYVRFVQWSPDLRETIINCLDTHEEGDIHDVIIEPTNNLAFVIVRSKKAISALIGHEGKTLKLAETLTNYSIDVQIDPKYEIGEQLSRIIPEISESEIEVLDIAIVEGQEVRILVSSKTHASPASVCGSYLEQLRSELGIMEWIYFCNKKENIEDAIVAALYPLRNEDVLRITRENPTKYLVVVKDRDIAARTIGTEGSHVRAAGQLLKIWIHIAPEDDIKE